MSFPKKSVKSLATAPKELVALGEIGGIGDALQVYTYKPFGQLYNEIDPQVEHLFTGMPYDYESDFHYMTNRYYDAETGAFTRPDPILDGLNHYSYVGGNPIMYTDPTGLRFVGYDHTKLGGPRGEGAPSADSGFSGYSQAGLNRSHALMHQGHGGGPVVPFNPSFGSSLGGYYKGTYYSGYKWTDIRGMLTYKHTVKVTPGAEGSSLAFNPATGPGLYVPPVPVNNPENVNRDLRTAYAPEGGTIYTYNYANLSSYGNQAIIIHQDGRISVLAHLDSFDEGLTQGGVVEAGQAIGTIGNTNSNINNMAVHLHWHILDGITINEVNRRNVYRAVYSQGNYSLDTGATINPMTAINNHGYQHPADGTITSFYGRRNPPPYNNPLYANHWGIDYGVLNRR